MDIALIELAHDLEELLGCKRDRPFLLDLRRMAGDHAHLEIGCGQGDTVASRFDQNIRKNGQGATSFHDGLNSSQSLQEVLVVDLKLHASLLS